MAKQREIEGLSAEMPFAEAGAAVLETRVAELVAHSHGVLDTEAISGVHDMRVATRRLRAALEVFAPCFPHGPHRKLLKEVKAVADALGERRDRDVAIESLARFSEVISRPDRPGIDSLIESFRVEQLRANESLAPLVSDRRVRRLRALADDLIAEARAAARPTDAAGGER